jgi:hypothetical protein
MGSSNCSDPLTFPILHRYYSEHILGYLPPFVLSLAPPSSPVEWREAYSTGERIKVRGLEKRKRLERKPLFAPFNKW